MGNYLVCNKHPGELSLAIPAWVGAVMALTLCHITDNSGMPLGSWPLKRMTSSSYIPLWYAIPYLLLQGIATVSPYSVYVG